MNNSSNQTPYTPKTARYPAVTIASALTINTKTSVVTGNANSSLVYDLWFRSTDGTARNFDIWIGANTTDAHNNRVQITIPGNSGNNGSTVIASLKALAPHLFRYDLAGNQYILLEDASISIWVENKAVTAGAIYVSAPTADM